MRQNNITKKEFDLNHENHISVKYMEEMNLSFTMVMTKNQLLFRRLSGKNELMGFLFIRFADGLYAYTLFQNEEGIMEITKNGTVQFNRFVRDFLLHEENRNVNKRLKEDIHFVLKEKYFFNKKNAC